eukprot:Rmarinus@m.17819
MAGWKTKQLPGVIEVILHRVLNIREENSLDPLMGFRKTLFRSISTPTQGTMTATSTNLLLPPVEWGGSHAQPIERPPGPPPTQPQSHAMQARRLPRMMGVQLCQAYAHGCPHPYVLLTAGYLRRTQGKGTRLRIDLAAKSTRTLLAPPSQGKQQQVRPPPPRPSCVSAVINNTDPRAAMLGLVQPKLPLILASMLGQQLAGILMRRVLLWAEIHRPAHTLRLALHLTWRGSGRPFIQGDQQSPPVLVAPYRGRPPASPQARPRIFFIIHLARRYGSGRETGLCDQPVLLPAFPPSFRGAPLQ